MAKFCTKCGKPLVEGTTCNCGNTETPVVETLNFEQPSMKDFQQANNMNQNMMAQPQAVAQPSKANNVINECIAILKGFFKKPVDTIKENANDSKFVHSLVMTGLCALSVVIFIIAMLSDFYGKIKDTMGSLVDVSAYEPAYFKIGLIAFIAVAALIALMALLAWLMLNKLFKLNTTYKQVLGIYGFSSIITTISILLATLGYYIDYRISLVLVGLGLGLNNHYVSVTLKNAGNGDDNKLGYVVVISQFVAVAVVTYVLYKVFGEDLVLSLNSFSTMGL